MNVAGDTGAALPVIFRPSIAHRGKCMTSECWWGPSVMFLMHFPGNRRAGKRICPPSHVEQVGDCPSVNILDRSQAGTRASPPGQCPPPVRNPRRNASPDLRCGGGPQAPQSAGGVRAGSSHTPPERLARRRHPDPPISSADRANRPAWPPGRGPPDRRTTTTGARRDGDGCGGCSAGYLGRTVVCGGGCLLRGGEEAQQLRPGVLAGEGVRHRAAAKVEGAERGAGLGPSRGQVG